MKCDSMSLHLIRHCRNFSQNKLHSSFALMFSTEWHSDIQCFVVPICINAGQELHALKNFCCFIFIFDQEMQCRDAGVCICWSSVCFKLQWVILNRRSVLSLSIHWKHWHQAGSVQPSESFVFLCATHMWASACLCNHRSFYKPWLHHYNIWYVSWAFT